MLGRTLFYRRTLLLVQFLLFSVTASHFSQYWTFSLPIFACLTLPWSLGEMIHWNKWWCIPVATETIQIFLMSFLQFKSKGTQSNHARFGLCQLFNSLGANPIKCSNTLKQFVGNLPKNFLSVFDHSVVWAYKELNQS